MSARPNPFRDLKPYNRVTIGGRLIKAILFNIDGHELEDLWNVQKPSGGNHGVAVYEGIKLFEGVRLFFECADGDGYTAAERYDDLSDIFDMMAPAPARGAAGRRPPTLTIENAILTRIGLTAINRKGWKEYPTETNSWVIELTVIQYAPPSPAATGAASAAKKPDGGAPTVDPEIARLRKERDYALAQAAAV